MYKRVVIRVAVLIMAVLICSVVGADPKSEADAKPAAKEKESAATLNVETKGSYIYWFTYTGDEGTPQITLPVRFKGKSTKMDVDKVVGGATLYVLDKGSNNLAIMHYDKGDNVDLATPDFQHVREVRLRVIAEDRKPIESAVVHITDGLDEKHMAVITPADEGVATFFNVATGGITVKVDAENLRKTIDSDITLPDERTTPGFQRDIKVSGDVNTLNVKPAASKSPEKKGKSGATSWANLLQTITGLAMLGVVIAVVLIVLRAKGITGKSALKGLGVHLPDEEQIQPDPRAPAASTVDPNVCQFCGQAKDAQGMCACSVVPGTTPTATSTAGVPRLIGSQGLYAGHVFEITSDTVVVGREPDNPAALPNDATASRRHATIFKSEGGYTIRDEGSSNGTFVNGARITEQRLTPGDEIQIGATKFRFEI